MFYYLWNKSTLKKFNYLKNRVLNLRKKVNSLTNEQLQIKFNYYRQKIQNKKKDQTKALNKYLVPVFALVREAIHRHTGLLLFPTQVFGGIVLHNANIAQMNTGEGKTLTAFLPICLNSLLNRNIFIITVNSYLTQRDWSLAKPILDFFQISSGVNLNNLSLEEKKFLYENHTVIYTTGSELGFDYLRNNLVTNIKNKVKQDYYYAIIDEVDSLLLDEGMNPLIISRLAKQESTIHSTEYQLATKLINSLIEKKDYKIEQKEKDIWLTNKGIKKIEEFYKLDNLFDFKNHRYNFLVHNALKTKHFYHKNVDYVVDKENEQIILVDALTGRLVPNRVYGSGIHQAIESKENLQVGIKNKTIATITYQNFFRLFDKLSGMTGTAKSEAKEFRQVYGMEVITTPPYRKLIRKDHNDLIFWDKKSKYKAIVDLIKKNNITKKRPILIGSPSVEISEYLSTLLTEEKISHNKLNAVNHKQEAEIIAQAGQVGTITISTNMAGRGTDIILSEESRKIGGLLVIGVERNTSRRIDNQLRGRSGRQGDPGESQFYVSLEDELVKNFGIKEQIGRIFSQKQLKELFYRPLSGKMFNYLISEPQETLRNIYSYNRQYVLNYDLLISRQRQFIYNYRNKLLEANNLTNLTKIISSERTKSTSDDLEYLKSKLVREIDNFWSDYLEHLNKIRTLVHVRYYLPQEPQEAFFWENISSFRSGYRQLKKKLNNILLIDK
ncbi:preprotein translocase subunit SecA [endosymbiont GvMRE of Glomus versiforme]|uniref:preprotein translocase subunit SecA n=1 Tax=endosymbiont GvMRE of Glomus versiforme TaxID=2039283 RepID=UPI000EE8C452|nr:preprotein translocase subunit SecA [endosymbiont GvMRE of Glomus versiforme]RHZ35437.1 Protein translocase subunit SecA [endosymbiont GvMRE of Glomus versiforme]